MSDYERNLRRFLEIDNDFWGDRDNYRVFNSQETVVSEFPDEINDNIPSSGSSNATIFDANYQPNTTNPRTRERRNEAARRIQDFWRRRRGSIGVRMINRKLRIKIAKPGGSKYESIVIKPDKFKGKMKSLRGKVCVCIDTRRNANTDTAPLVLRRMRHPGFWEDNGNSNRRPNFNYNRYFPIYVVNPPDEYFYYQFREYNRGNRIVRYLKFTKRQFDNDEYLTRPYPFYDVSPYNYIISEHPEDEQWYLAGDNIENIRNIARRRQEKKRTHRQRIN